MCHGQILSDVVHRARKEHRCSLCNKVIPPGHHYSRQVSAGFGEITVVKTCRRCFANWSAVWAEWGEDACHTDPLSAMRDECREQGWRKWLAQVREARKTFNRMITGG